MKKIMATALIMATVLSGCSSQSQAAANSKATQEASVGVEQKLPYKNSSYTNYVDLKDIKTDVKTLGGSYSKYYDKYIQYIAPNGKPITIVAQDKVSKEQMLKAYNVLSFYLESDSQFDKTKVANSAADNGALLVMPNGADGESNLPEEAFMGQPLYQNETVVPGSQWYIENDYSHRDAAFEEIFHLVHDTGIGLKNSPKALPDYQKEIYKATMNALPKDKAKWGKEGLWGLNSKEWLLELEQEGSLEQEYYASVLDSYYGLWGPYTESKGGMWGLYTSKLRSDIEKNDPLGYAMLEKYLPQYLTMMSRIDPSFEGTFEMTFNKEKSYTHKSQYMQNARLTGSKNSNLLGNDQDNILMGNSGDNTIDGQGGKDIVQVKGASSEYTLVKNETGIVLTDTLKREGTDLLKNIEVIRFTDQDMSL